MHLAAQPATASAAVPEAVSVAASGPVSPLAGAYARLAEVFPGLCVTEEPPRTGEGWTGARRPADAGPALDDFLAPDEEQSLRDHGRRPRPDVTAAFGLHRYVWHACLLFTVPCPAPPGPAARPRRRLPVPRRRRGPDDGPSGPRFRLPVRRSGRRAAAGPERGGRGGAPRRTAGGRRRARRAGAGRLPAANAARRAGAVGYGHRRRQEGLWYIGSLLGQEDRAVAELGRLLPGGTTPYAGGASFRRLPGPNGEPVLTRDRISRCLYCTLCPEDPCVACPRTCDADRIRRLAATA
jgi:hypothetical protein